MCDNHDYHRSDNDCFHHNHHHHRRQGCADVHSQAFGIVPAFSCKLKPFGTSTSLSVMVFLANTSTTLRVMTRVLLSKLRLPNGFVFPEKIPSHSPGGHWVCTGECAALGGGLKQCSDDGCTVLAGGMLSRQGARS